MVNRTIGDPPPEGAVKLRVRSNGNPHETRVVVVDHDGAESEVLGVVEIAWHAHLGPVLPMLRVVVDEADVELDAERVTMGVPAAGAREERD